MRFTGESMMKLILVHFLDVGRKNVVGQKSAYLDNNHSTKKFIKQKMSFGA